jgi:chemotaxis protein CheD
MRSKHLNTGDACIGSDADVLTTGGVGSCVVLCLWDEKMRIGGMAHMLLGSSKDLCTRDGLPTLGCAPDIALHFLLRSLLAKGTRKENLIIRLVGGGNMFGGLQMGPHGDIGFNIVQKTTEVIEAAGLRVASQRVGGFFGRSVQFDIKTGIIDVVQTNGNREVL